MSDCDFSLCQPCVALTHYPRCTLPSSTVMATRLILCAGWVVTDDRFVAYTVIYKKIKIDRWLNRIYFNYANNLGGIMGWIVPLSSYFFKMYSRLEVATAPSLLKEKSDTLYFDLKISSYEKALLPNETQSTIVQVDVTLLVLCFCYNISHFIL